MRLKAQNKGLDAEREKRDKAIAAMEEIGKLLDGSEYGMLTSIVL
jgi:hypothetical protein